jgi:hypothetical protein
LNNLVSPYYIVITRTNPVLLSFLKVRLIIDNKHIYPLNNDQPVIIPVTNNHPKIVATDGFHYTFPMELHYDKPSYYRLRVTCAIDDLQLLGSAFLLILFYLAGFATGIWLLKMISFLPLGYLLISYYIRRRSFIRIVPVRT